MKKLRIVAGFLLLFTAAVMGCEEKQREPLDWTEILAEYDREVFEAYESDLSEAQRQQLKKQISEVRMPHFQCVVPIDFSKGCFTYDILNGLREKDINHVKNELDSLNILILYQTIACVLHDAYPTDENILVFSDDATQAPELRVLALDGEKLTDKCIDGFVNFKKLKILDLGETQITEAGWAKLRKMLPECEMQPKEKTFSINVLEMLYQDGYALNFEWIGEEITDEDVVALADLPLEGLILDYNNITDKALDSIAKMKSLKYLSLRCTKITDAGLKKLAELPKLEILDIGGTGITDTGVATLAKFPSLKKLSVAYAPITGKGFAAFPETCKIEQLILLLTEVGDGALKNIAKWKILKYLDISMTINVSRTGLSYVTEKPGLVVHRDMRGPGYPR